MREALISILALLTVAPFAKTSEIGKDGFNLYKGKKYDCVFFCFLLIIPSGLRILYNYFGG